MYRVEAEFGTQTSVHYALLYRVASSDKSKCSLCRGADKSLARPGRKQATAIKL